MAERTDNDGGAPERARPDFDHSPWRFWSEGDQDEHARQLARQRQLAAGPGAHRFGERCFVSELASVEMDELRLGEGSYVAAGAYLTGTLRTGRDCTMNPYTVVRGDIELGDAVRIGAHTSLLGFNHTMTDPDVEVHRQPITSRGIRVGNDVWIGSHVVVLDGVRVGDRSVIGAGAVVTKDVPAGAVVGGNPARVLRWRVPELAPPADGGSVDGGSADGGSAGRAGHLAGASGQSAAARPGALAGALAAFADTAREQAERVLARCFDPTALDGGAFVDRPGAAPTVRAQCDAIEIADLLLGRAPDQLPADEQVRRLRSWQDPATGMVGPLLPDGTQRPPEAGLFDPAAGYHVLSVGYALDLLGSRFAEPVRVVAEAEAAEIVAGLERQPWRDGAWQAGDWVDILGTAFSWNLELGAPGQPGAREALFGWLLARADPRTGMWGEPRPADGLLQIVNGFYRASRGTFAQFGLPVPYPERVVDTVLAHARDARYTDPRRQNACNILDIAHPLWLTRGAGHRSAEVTALAERLLAEALGHWTAGAGFGFQAPHPKSAGVPATEPGLQGTEMWLAIVWLLADLVGLADQLGYRPRGVHRPEARRTLVR
ncbi:acyltransferase [Streptomyces sp. DSM 44915]|uniref:Acyltransferase n=1 Tax=Streptomyces chisholmiae TaxID=3075540 RepID=A0ABU2JL34_9ACTN|nr:acyltransferase [Streptomyces sp. DSM 44915]MDT0265697.1 acyltransferase [Streptomyces sp. DSM 44915]